MPAVVLLTQQVAAHVLYSVCPADPHAAAPNAHHGHIIEAVWHATHHERNQMRHVYPAYVAAVELVIAGRIEVLCAAAHGVAHLN